MVKHTILILTIVLSFQFSPIFAASSDLIINEIMYDCQGSDDGCEWIELKNNSVDTITIDSNWRFFDGTSHTFTLFQGDTNISPGSYIILSTKPETFLANHQGFLGTIFKTAISLNNTGEILKISSDKGDTWFGEISYSKNQGASGNGKTLEYDQTVGVTDSEHFRESYISGGTPGKQNSTVVDIPQYSKEVFINEIYPNPATGEDEFIELFNSSENSVDLSGWKVDDAIGSGSAEFLIKEGTIITSKSFMTLYQKDTKIALNNDGDNVNLIWPDNRISSTLPYPKSEKNLSYSRNQSGIWNWTTKVTPGFENSIDSPVSSDNSSSSSTPKETEKQVAASKTSTTRKTSTKPNENSRVLSQSIAAPSPIPSSSAAALTDSEQEAQKLLADLSNNNTSKIEDQKITRISLTSTAITGIIISSILLIAYIFYIWKKKSLPIT